MGTGRSGVSSRSHNRHPTRKNTLTSASLTPQTNPPELPPKRTLRKHTLTGGNMYR
jgi:hypothetical protein